MRTNQELQQAIWNGKSLQYIDHDGTVAAGGYYSPEKRAVYSVIKCSHASGSYWNLSLLSNTGEFIETSGHRKYISIDKDMEDFKIEEYYREIDARDKANEKRNIRSIDEKFEPSMTF